MSRFISPFFLVLCFFLMSCGSRQTPIQSFRFHENARQKPVAVLVPLILRDENRKVSWNLSHEITSEVQKRLVNHAQIFLNPVRLSETLKHKIQDQDLVTLSGDDLSELKSQNEYAIFMELIEHKEFPSDRSDYKSTSDFNHLSVKVRLRVFDLRAKEPKVLLQEILHYNPYIPAVERDIDYAKVVWGGDSYPASLYGRTHTKLEKDLVHQIETYISISK